MRNDHYTGKCLSRLASNPLFATGAPSFSDKGPQFSKFPGSGEEGKSNDLVVAIWSIIFGRGQTESQSLLSLRRAMQCLQRRSIFTEWGETPARVLDFILFWCVDLIGQHYRLVGCGK